MGGSGSGGWCRWNNKSVVSSYLEISVSRMVIWGKIQQGNITNGNLHWSMRGEKFAEISCNVNTWDSPPTMTLRYTNTSGRTGEKTELNYPVYLTTTIPHYGGVRWWFLCPAKGCGKRVGNIYGGKIFACRTCHNLAYESQNQTAPFRLLDQAQNVHRKLEGNMDWWGVTPPKPKGMHQKTYDRKIVKLKRLSRAANIAVMQQYSGDPQSMEILQDLFCDLDD